MQWDTARGTPEVPCATLGWGLSPGLSLLPPWSLLKGDSPEGEAQRVTESPLLRSVAPGMATDCRGVSP